MPPRPRSHLSKAHTTIFAQPAPKRIQVSAWRLYLHELERVNPKTKRPYTPRKALINTLEWMRDLQRRDERTSRRLTPRQRQMVEMLVQGLKHKQIARQLGISAGTVKFHFAKAQERLGVETIYQVVALSVEEGWIKASSLVKIK